jgi:hypothetical protein
MLAAVDIAFGIYSHGISNSNWCTEIETWALLWLAIMRLVWQAPVPVGPSHTFVRVLSAAKAASNMGRATASSPSHSSRMACYINQCALTPHEMRACMT